jgi:hypothetical protein
MGKSVKTVATICPTVSLCCQGLSPLSAAAFHHNITLINSGLHVHCESDPLSVAALSASGDGVCHMGIVSMCE